MSYQCEEPSSWREWLAFALGLVLVAAVLFLVGCSTTGPRSASRISPNLPDGRPDIDWGLYGTDGQGGKIMFCDVPGGRLYQNLRTGAMVFAPGEIQPLELQNPRRGE